MCHKTSTLTAFIYNNFEQLYGHTRILESHVSSILRQHGSRWADTACVYYLRKHTALSAQSQPTARVIDEARKIWEASSAIPTKYQFEVTAECWEQRRP